VQTDQPPIHPEGHDRRRKWLILAVLASVAFMAQLDLFIVNVAIPSIGLSFSGAPLSDLSWILNGYAVVFAALLVPAARLADHYGRKRFLLVGVVTFIGASAICAAAPSVAVLIAGRAVQAAGAAAIVPASLGLLLPSFPQRQHNLVVGVWSATAALAASAGPPLGGLLVAVDWRWIFLVNLPVGLVTVAVGARVLPEIRAKADSHLPDPLSIVSLLAAVTLLTFGLVEGTTWGWSSARLIGVLAGALVAAAVTIYRTLRHPNAVIEVSLFESREFGTASLTLFLYYIGFAAFLLSSVLYLQDLWHYDALRAGLAIAPGPITAGLFAVNGGKIIGRFGRTTPAAVGAVAIVASAIYLLALAPLAPDYLQFLPGILLCGASAGLVQAPLYASAGTLPVHRTTTGSGVLNMARQLGSVVGVATLVALLNTSHPNSLAPFDRGWVLQLISGALATVGLLALARRRVGSASRQAAGVAMAVASSDQWSPP
jgi:EmrB/QacA subfamily drug resistance transporter